ncbi:hypothetical protein [Cytobacillus sp. BC1816]
MAGSINLDREEIYVFNSAIYIFESSAGSTLEVDLTYRHYLQTIFK